MPPTAGASAVYFLQTAMPGPWRSKRQTSSCDFGALTRALSKRKEGEFAFEARHGMPPCLLRRETRADLFARRLREQAQNPQARSHLLDAKGKIHFTAHQAFLAFGGGPAHKHLAIM